jgi:hypothetical protein
MDFELPEELRLLKETVRNFVDRELIPVEMASMDGAIMRPEVRAPLEEKAKKLGLWHLDVPAEYGGAGLNLLGMVVVWEEIARTIAMPPRGPSVFGPDIRHVLFTLNPAQKEKYLFPVLRGEKNTAFAQSEPDAGADQHAQEATWLLQAIDPARKVPPVLLIDELDRTDEPFEAFLLEVLSEFQITIPEFGTVKAATPPIVVLTSNRTREIHDAVKRRCLYHWVGFPDAARELQVLQRRVPGVAQQLAQQVVGFVQRLRQVELYKQPGIAETIEWARALMQLDALVLDPAVIQDTLGVLLKYQDDIARMQGGEAARLLEEVRNAARAPV